MRKLTTTRTAFYAWPIALLFRRVYRQTGIPIYIFGVHTVKPGPYGYMLLQFVYNIGTVLAADRYGLLNCFKQFTRFIHSQRIVERSQRIPGSAPVTCHFFDQK